MITASKVSMRLSQISAAKEKKPRQSSRPKKSEIEKFLGDGTDSDTRLRRLAAALWERHWLTIEQQHGARAIEYTERVNKSLTHLGVETWMARHLDKKDVAQQYRDRTSRRGRALLDAIIVYDHKIERCAEIVYGSANQSRIKEARSEIRTFLDAFAALARLPGSE